jgi:hypothetical protein
MTVEFVQLLRDAARCRLDLADPVDLKEPPVPPI